MGNGIGNPTILMYFPSSTFVKNVIAGASESTYPVNNYYPSRAVFDQSFKDPAAGDFTQADDLLGPNAAWYHNSVL